MKIYFILVLLILMTASACATGDINTATGERMLVSTAVGAGSGAIIGSAFNNAGAGALVGTGAGLLGGYLYDQWRKSQEAPPPPTTPAPVYDRYGNPVTAPSY
jgi:hypothetical protein